MISSRKDAWARALFFFLFLHPLHRVFSCPLKQTRSGFFSTSILSFFTLLSRTRDRRLASEIPLSTLVAVDRLTSFEFSSVRRRCIIESTEKTTNGRNRIISVEADELEPWAAPPFSSSPDRALPSQRHRALLGKKPEIFDISSKRRDFVSIDENGACRPRLAPQWRIPKTLLKTRNGGTYNKRENRLRYGH